MKQKVNQRGTVLMAVLILLLLALICVGIWVGVSLNKQPGETKPKATTISKSAFEYCAALTTLNLPLANSLGGSFIGCANSLTELRLTARGTISVTTDASAASDKTFYSAPTTQIDLYLNRDKQSEVNNGNTWNGCVFKSITFV